MEDRYSVVFDCGFATPVNKVTVKDVTLITKAVSLHATVFLVKAELDQLADGLELFGIVGLMRKHPNKMKPLFVYDPMDKPTAELMIALFDVHFSPPGTSKRVTEETAILYWNELLQDMANGLISKLYIVALLGFLQSERGGHSLEFQNHDIIIGFIVLLW